MRRKNQVTAESQLLLSSKQLATETSSSSPLDFKSPSANKEVSAATTPTSLAQRSRSRTSYPGGKTSVMLSSENINEWLCSIIGCFN